MSHPAHKNQRDLTDLRWQWGWYALAGIIFYGGGFLFLKEAWSPKYAWRWLGLVLGVFGYILWTLWINLDKNQRPGEEALLPELGAGNLASLTRGVLIAALYGFLFSPVPENRLAWLPGGLYTAAVLVDAVDGVLARLTNHATRLGEILDMCFDGLGMLAATALIVQYGQAPAWYILIGLARYLFLFGIWLRERLGKINYPMPASVRRRWMAAVQMGFVSVILWPVFSPPETHVIAIFFGLPLLIGFVWDWLYVSGVITLETPQRYAVIKDFILKWVPVGLRFGVLIFTIPTLISAIEPTPFMLLMWINLTLVLAGAAGRTAAIAGLISLGLHPMKAALSPIELLRGILYAMILLLGSGAFSLWKPEDRLIYRKLGESPLRRFQRKLDTESK